MPDLNTSKAIKGFCALITISLLISSLMIFHIPFSWAQKESDMTKTSPSSAIAPQIRISDCQPMKPLADPVDMNTIIFKDIAKTIHVEKEILNCKIQTGGSVLAMISIFTELFENVKTQSSLNKTVEAVTCIKAYNGTVLWCQSKNIPITNEYPLSAINCDPQNLKIQNQPSPIEMETVVGPNGIVKTVEAEKEVFLCDLKQGAPTKSLDVIIFTELFENMLSETTIKRNIETVSCIKDLSNAEVIKCGSKKFI